MDGSGLPPWQGVLDFWFGSATDDGVCAERQSSLWWGKSAQTDGEIRRRYESLLQVLVNGGNRYWLQFPESRLAAIIVLDQFSRNIYRDTPTAFAADRLVLSWSLTGIASGMDKALRPIHRVFFYLPLEHAEDPAMQVQSVALFEKLLAQAPENQRGVFEGFLDFARRHAEVIQQFGRFPHRNAILGRTSSPAEQAYLARPGSGF